MHGKDFIEWNIRTCELQIEAYNNYLENELYNTLQEKEITLHLISIQKKNIKNLEKELTNF